MKYVSLPNFQIITDALNFSTVDYHVLGSCDLYTIKAGKGDRKLYNRIDETLQSQHESLVRFSASLSPPQLPVDGKEHAPTPMTMPEIDLSRESPFGDLNQVAARRAYSYFIATLNAAHPDYEFSNVLRPDDFKRKSLGSIKRSVDSTLMNLRPRRLPSALSPPPRTRNHYANAALSAFPNPETVWNETLWDRIDAEMDLAHCEKFTWQPSDDPFEEESILWAQHHFFYHKDKKRVCYLNFRAYSVISHSPISFGLHMPASSAEHRSTGIISVGEGAGKRSQYWLGHNVKNDAVDDSWAEDDDTMVDGEYMDDLDDIRDHLEDGPAYYSEDDDFLDSDDASAWGKPRYRGSSEGVADAMEL